MSRIVRYSLLALLMLLTACGGAAPVDTTSGQTGGGARGGASGASGGAMTEAGDTTTATTTDVIAMLTRSGGIQGKTQTIVVKADGSIALTNGDANGEVVKMAQAPAAVINQLQSAFAGSDWQALEASYGKQFPDAFQYTISAAGKQVTTYDGAQNPPVLGQILKEMNTLLQAAQTG